MDNRIFSKFAGVALLAGAAVVATGCSQKDEVYSSPENLSEMEMAALPQIERLTYFFRDRAVKSCTTVNGINAKTAATLGTMLLVGHDEQYNSFIRELWDSKLRPDSGRSGRTGYFKDMASGYNVLNTLNDKGINLVSVVLDDISATQPVASYINDPKTKQKTLVLYGYSNGERGSSRPAISRFYAAGEAVERFVQEVAKGESQSMLLYRDRFAQDNNNAYLVKQLAPGESFYLLDGLEETKIKFENPCLKIK